MLRPSRHSGSPASRSRGEALSKFAACFGGSFELSHPTQDLDKGAPTIKPRSCKWARIVVEIGGEHAGSRGFTPNVEINKLFRLVRDDVWEATAGRQEPYTYGSLPGHEDFFFVQK